MHFQTDNSKDTEFLHSSSVTTYSLCQHRKFVPCFLILAFMFIDHDFKGLVYIAVYIIDANISILFSLP